MNDVPSPADPAADAAAEALTCPSCGGAYVTFVEAAQPATGLRRAKCSTCQDEWDIS